MKIDVLTLCFCDGRDFKSSLSAVFKANYLTRDNVRNFPYIYIKILFAVGDGWNSEQVKQIIGSGWHIRTVIALRAGLIQSVIRHNYNQYELTPFGKVLHDLLLKEFRRLELEFKQKFDDLEGFDIYLPENKYK